MFINMKLKTPSRTVIFFILIATNCFARISETLEKCKERYGDAVSTTERPFDSIYYFKKDEIEISVSIRNNKAYQISYKKPGMTIEEANVLLGVNGILCKFNNEPRDGMIARLDQINKRSSYSLDKKPNDGLDAVFFDYRAAPLNGGFDDTQLVILNPTIANKVKELTENKEKEGKLEQAEKLKDGF
jgi:hypothetical protein